MRNTEVQFYVNRATQKEKCAAGSVQRKTHEKLHISQTITMSLKKLKFQVKIPMKDEKRTHFYAGLMNF